jgi:hypothetical protein
MGGAMRAVLGLAVLILASLPATSSHALAEELSGQTAPGLFIQSDLVSGLPGSDCWYQNRFSPGQRVVFRAKVFDAATGQVAPNATVTVRLADGTTLPLPYSGHPPGPNPTDNFWAGGWTVPADAPLGVVRYTIEATDGPRSGRFEPLNVELSMLTIVPAGQGQTASGGGPGPGGAGPGPGGASPAGPGPAGPAGPGGPGPRR